jgi:hypothetical protein
MLSTQSTAEGSLLMSKLWCWPLFWVAQRLPPPSRSNVNLILTLWRYCRTYIHGLNKILLTFQAGSQRAYSQLEACFISSTPSTYSLFARSKTNHHCSAICWIFVILFGPRDLETLYFPFLPSVHSYMWLHTSYFLVLRHRNCINE